MKKVLKYLPVVAIVVIVGVALIPISTIILDTLIAVNLAFAFLILLIAVSAKDIKEFKLLPTTILLSTIFNLAINLSAIRLIFTKGLNFDGRIIRFISLPLLNSTTGLIIGYTIFILLMSVFTIIITKGVTRVSEIAARFTLDSMAVKMMAIEVELGSGAITEEEAILIKRKVQQESDFFGSIDGASKFVSGNARLTIFTTIVIIIGGVLVEYFLRAASLNNAISIYLGFSASTCLLFMFPPFLLSTAMGVVITRVVRKSKDT